MKLKYYISRILESPFRFLLKKAFFEFKKHFLYRFFGESIVNYKMFELRNVSLSNKSLLLEINNEEKEYLEQRLLDVKNGFWPCLGYGLVDIKSKSAFSFDDVHDYKWPYIYFADIDFLTGKKRCDVKIPWEKSRLQFVTEIALLVQSHELSEESKGFYVNFALEIIKRWDKENKIFMGVNWITSMEVAIRGVNLVHSYNLMQRYLSCSEKKFFLELIKKHFIYLKLFPEFSDVQGNHYLATMIGECVIKHFLGLPIDVKQIEIELQQQFDDNGFHIEYSPLYHRLCVEMVFFLYFYCELSTSKKISSLIQRLKISLTFFETQTGLLPVFGDSDSGKLFDFGQNERRFNWLLGETPYVSELLLRKVFLGFESVSNSTDKKQSLLNDDINNRKLLTLAPLYKIGTDKLACFVKCGKQGLRGRASHDHDDNLSFWCSYANEEVITERGCVPYTLDVSLRDECIRSSSHNVAFPLKERYELVDGSIYKTVKGAPDGIAELVESCKFQAILSNQINMFTHRRLIETQASQLTIIDEINSDSDACIVNFHFHPRFQLTKSTEDNRFLIESDGYVHSINFESCDCSTVINEVAISKYNFSGHYGMSDLACKLTVVVSSKQTISLRTLLEFEL